MCAGWRVGVLKGESPADSSSRVRTRVMGSGLARPAPRDELTSRKDHGTDVGGDIPCLPRACNTAGGTAPQLVGLQYVLICIQRSSGIYC